MDFDYYFMATEESFAEEKQHMLSRIDELRKGWEETTELDLLTSQKCSELTELKNILSKNHLQILRTREEMLNAEFLNMKLQFQNRLLQNEIWRLLPYAETESSTIDYKINLDLNQYERPKQLKVKPDEKFKKQLTNILHKWENLTETQKLVFEDEENLRARDDVVFSNFYQDFVQQNQCAHKLIDEQLDDLLHRIMFEQSTLKDSSSQNKMLISAMERKKEALLSKFSKMESDASEKKIKQRELSQKKGDILLSSARERIRNIERNNIKRYNQLKDQDTDLRALLKAKTESVKKLTVQYKKLKKCKGGFLKQGKSQIEMLENQLNALISAASAMKLCPEFEHQYIINAVSSAVNNHADSIMTYEEMSLKVKNMGDRINKLTQIFS